MAPHPTLHSTPNCSISMAKSESAFTLRDWEAKGRAFSMNTINSMRNDREVTKIA